MGRGSYRNGEAVAMELNGCDGCSPSMVNGRLCHEPGCPDAWRDTARECPECGTWYYPTERHQQTCSHTCSVYYSGQYCDCDRCNPDAD